MDVGKNIRAMREMRGISQTQLAEDLNISRGMVGGIETETKQPSLALALEIARYFGVSVEMLAGTERSGRNGH